MPRGDLFPDIGPFETGYLPLSTSIVGVLGASRAIRAAFRCCSCMADQARVLVTRCTWPVFRPRASGASSFSISAAPVARGALGGLENSTTPDLVDDIERLRVHLGVSRWLLFGGSWGSTLALAYAQAHPECVAACVLRGICLGRPSEVDWFLHGLATVFPDIHAQFVSHLFTANERHADILGSFLRRLVDPDPAVHIAVSGAPGRSSRGSCSTLLPSYGDDHDVRAGSDSTGAGADRGVGTSPTTCFCLGGRLARSHGSGAAPIPGEIVQGRYDMICPATTAFELANAWRGARLTVVPDAGHSALEPGIRRALVAAVERFLATCEYKRDKWNEK